jgi:Na+/H+-dicarboxylate symporter
MSLSFRILLALVVGLGGGALAAGSGMARLDTLLAVAQPVGQIWLDGLTMTIVPLVFGLLVTGVAAAAGRAAAGGVAARALGWFAGLLVASAVVGGLTAEAIVALVPLPEGAAAMRTATGAAPEVAGAADWLTGIVPSNPIRAAADGAMVSIVFFALLFGFAATRIAESGRAVLVGFFRAVTDTMLVLVHWVLLLAPIGVLALAFGVGARLGIGAAGALLHYVLTLSAVNLTLTLAMTILAVVVGRIGPAAFMRAAAPAQLVALGTQSSLASLPAMIESVPGLGVKTATGGIVLPLAVSLFKASTSAANIGIAVYLSHLYGIEIGPGTLVLGMLVSAAMSLAAVGLPGQVSFFTAVAPVCIAMGVPIAILPLLLAVETIPTSSARSATSPPTSPSPASSAAATRSVGTGEDGGDQRDPVDVGIGRLLELLPEHVGSSSR